MAKNKQLLIEIGQGLSMMVGLPTIPSWKSKDRPKSPVTGTLGFNDETISLEYWDGKNWFEAPLSS